MRVINGKEVFKWVDTYGLPLDIINLELRDRGAAFNASEFIEAALKAGWTPKRIKWMMKHSNDEINKKIDTFIQFHEKTINNASK